MFKKVTFTVLAVSAVGLTGCQQMSNKAEAAPTGPTQTTENPIVNMSEKERAVVAKLDWVRTANAMQDAQKTLAKPSGEKPEIIAFSGRGKSYPGLTAEEYSEIEPFVTFRFAEGSGDVIQGPTHKQLRRDLRAYVKTYNKAVYESVTRNK